MLIRAIFLCLLLAIGVSPAAADALSDCRQGRDQRARMEGCSSVIASKTSSAADKALAYRHRGEARLRAGAHGEAIADFSEAIRLVPGSAAAFSGRAQSRMATGDTAAAIADLSQAILLAPNAQLYVERGHAHLVTGTIDAAIADFDAAIRLDSGHASAHNNRALAYRKKGDMQKALADYDKAVALSPLYALAYNNRGYTYEAMGKREEAIADFRRALSIDPSLVGAKDGLKRLGVTGVLTEESDRIVQEGKGLAEKNCGWCHQTGAKGQSPNAKAPEFRNIQRRHPILALRDPLSRGIAAPHDEMPNFKMSDAEVDSIIAYINSLPASD